MKIVFMGTPEFSVSFLEELNESEHEVVLVMTQPDRPSGRGRKLTPPPVKVRAEELGIEVFQPDDLKSMEVEKKLSSYDADLFLVVAYSILPKNLLAVPKKGSMNIHTSLLPKYRGAAPIQWALAKGEEKTGVTLFLLDEKMDHGPIVEQAEVSIELVDNSETIYEKLLIAGRPAMMKAIEKVEHGNFTPKVQDHSLACGARKLKKEDGLLDWNESVFSIHNKVRGFSPWPCCYSFLNEKPLKILKSHPHAEVEELALLEPGNLALFRKKLYVAAIDGWLELKEVQPQGKKPMDGMSLMNGLGKKEGVCLQRQV